MLWNDTPLNFYPHQLLREYDLAVVHWGHLFVVAVEWRVLGECGAHVD